MSYPEQPHSGMPYGHPYPSQYGNGAGNYPSQPAPGYQPAQHQYPQTQYPPAQYPQAPQYQQLAPVHALLWRPLDMLTRVVLDPEGRFVLRGHPPTIHAMVIDTYRSVGLKIRFNAEQYRPKKVQGVTGVQGSAFKSAIDPTPGLLHTYGALSSSWAWRPNDYIFMAILQTTGSYGGSYDMSQGTFPKLCLGLYQLFMEHRMLVWAGELGYGGFDDDLAQWTTAPGSPTPQAPYETTNAGKDAAWYQGWRPTTL